MDRHFWLQNKKILLLIDNAPSHFDPHYLPADQDEDEKNEIASTSGKSERGIFSVSLSDPSFMISKVYVLDFTSVLSIICSIVAFDRFLILN